MRAVDHVIARFPGQDMNVRLLYLQDEQFRAICEDFRLAIDSLRNFQNRPDAHLRAEIDEYREVLRDLEAELRDYLARRASR